MYSILHWASEAISPFYSFPSRKYSSDRPLKGSVIGLQFDGKREGHSVGLVAGSLMSTSASAPLCSRVFGRAFYLERMVEYMRADLCGLGALVAQEVLSATQVDKRFP